VGIRGRYARQIFGVPGDRATIGRECDNDLVFAGTSLSRRHALVERDAKGSWLLTDLCSANGTTLNGHTLAKPTALKHGDRLRFAQEDFLFIDADNHKFDTRGYKLAEKETILLGKLLFDRGTGPEELLLEETTVTLGREPTNDLVLDLPGISGNHCKIRIVDEVFTLVDLSSTNGTFLASTEERIESLVLTPGCEFLIGSCRIRFDTERVTRAKPSEVAAPSFLQGPSTLDILLPVLAAFLLLLTIFFTILLVFRPSSTLEMSLPPPPHLETEAP
jgi:pSer/pThr/pTyr-binding forkhead associated (FHA) protein